MRAVALSDDRVQEMISGGFVPLKVEMKPGTKDLPLDWPALGAWRFIYRLNGGEESAGFTACVVVSPDLETVYGHTGSAMVWELFDSIAYDAGKFAAMLERASGHAARERAIRAEHGDGGSEKEWALREFRTEVDREVAKHGGFRLPPPGFTVEGAKRLFELSGDLEVE